MTTDMNCTPVGTPRDLPTHLFTEEQLRHGAVIVHIAVLIYMVYALCLESVRYFIPAMEVMCERFHIPEGVAGATLVAFGSSAGELLITLISVIIGSGTIGFGTVIGTSTFTAAFIPGCCGLVLVTAFRLDWWPVFRDTSFYMIGCIAVMLMLRDSVIVWFEAFLMVIMYCGYILFMYFDKRISEGLRVAMKRNEDSRADLLQTEEEENYGTNGSANDEKNVLQREEEKSGETNLKEIQNNEPDVEMKEYSPFHVPNSIPGKFIWIIGFPISIVFYFTIPDCSLPRWRSWFLFTFFMSMVWLGAISYVIIWMIDVMGFVFGIPDIIIGLVFAAIGSNAPSLVVSILAAKKGYVDMAIANAFGSNVFNILLCLGLPWMVSSLLHPIDGWHAIWIERVNMVYIAVILSLSGLLPVLCLALSRWKLIRINGIILLFIYILIITSAVLYQMLQRQYC
ncbi:sodium/potassium/calcium exchanger 4-like [Glandiceps talaboti]